MVLGCEIISPTVYTWYYYSTTEVFIITPGYDWWQETMFSGVNTHGVPIFAMFSMLDWWEVSGNKWIPKSTSRLMILVA